jgi:hypothetical protein
MGSREFVEDFVAKLADRAVVYLNNDICNGESVIVGATTFNITTLSITTLSIKGLFVTLSVNDIQHK